ncbi:MAG: DNA repair exonuclease [Clostridia bacterium]|nr:DNA repair exonuclease [Clostridia bacterium]
MKFVHIADLHLDAPFTVLNANNRLGEKRREEQLKTFEKVIEYIKENKIEFLFISGDLYENEYVKESTIEKINNLFKQIEDTEIFISPGNHDPYLKNSYYRTFNWNNNVHIFNSEIKKYSYENLDIYGYGFEDFYVKNSDVENIKIENKEKINILVVHGDLDVVSEYNPMSSQKLKEIGFDYIALGHVHTTNFKTNERIVYPGSLVGLGFDETGEHGMVVGNINKNNISTEFIKLDSMEFIENELDISEKNTLEEIIEEINNLNIEENKFYKVILLGNRKFNIDLNKINKKIIFENIIKLKDNTQINYNLEEIAKQDNMKGYFVSELLNKLETSDNKEEIKRAIEIGLEVL